MDAKRHKASRVLFVVSSLGDGMALVWLHFVRNGKNAFLVRPTLRDSGSSIGTSLPVPVPSSQPFVNLVTHLGAFFYLGILSPVCRVQALRIQSLGIRNRVAKDSKGLDGTPGTCTGRLWTGSRRVIKVPLLSDDGGWSLA
ncbi:uncharacterized protein LY79DRAFT_575229 [Colletotrichum navitas]|uniref:Uncharacterized protein n=1 Tax=Colletotrichum navitas TaxID=681940 RepID=A0AAD8QC61_9PEZI|nr:uncharacterized protein LY79DRAFT_575229 [Colletotrichum navitas]KAK1599559.1 hypothetical protein LY79DRAFT_575229 [Colletotrichum navitas]